MSVWRVKSLLECSKVLKCCWISGPVILTHVQLYLLSTNTNKGISPLNRGNIFISLWFFSVSWTSTHRKCHAFISLFTSFWPNKQNNSGWWPLRPSVCLFCSNLHWAAHTAEFGFPDADAEEKSLLWSVYVSDFKTPCSICDRKRIN